jgi:hypothetical protein
MSDSSLNLESFPSEYQRVLQNARERLDVEIILLQQLVGGWSGAVVYLVSVTSGTTGLVEHLILKLDRKRPKSSTDEISRHQLAVQESPAGFAERHIPNIAFGRVQTDEAIAIFYAIAGQSLFNFLTLSKFRQQNRLEMLFKATNDYLLVEWNAGLDFEAVEHPQALLKRWLGFRLNPGQNIEQFFKVACQLNPRTAGCGRRGRCARAPG